MFSPLHRLSELSGGAGRGEEDGPDADSSSIDLVTKSRLINAVSPSTDTPSSQEYIAFVSRSSGSISILLARINTIITEAHARIQRQADDLIENLKKSKNPRIRELLLPPLNKCLRVGIKVKELLEQNRSNFGEFRVVGDMLTSYVKDLEQVTHRVPLLLQSEWTAIITGRSSANELQRAAHRLESTLQEVSPGIEILTLSVQAVAFQEENLRDELKKTKFQVVSAKPKFLSLDRPEQFHSLSSTSYGASTKEISSSDYHPYAHHSREKAPQSSVNTKHLESLAYLSSRPYRDVPGAYIRRHEYMRKYVVTESESWFTYTENFRQWVNNQKFAFLSCEGPRGVGKSVIATRVIDWLQRKGLQHAYFYLGIGKVQTATGVALALLAQLCVISGYNSSFLDLLRPNKQLTTTREVNDEGRVGPRRRRPSTRPKSIFYGNMRTGASLATVTLSPHRDIETLETVARPESPLPTPPSRTQTQISVDGPEPPNSGGDTRAQPHDPAVKGTKRVEIGESDDLDYDQNRPHQEAAKDDELLQSIKKIGEDSMHSVPELGILIQAVHEVRLQCERQLFIVLDGWDEDNMVNPGDFLSLLRALEADGCKIFLTSRSAIQLSDETGVIRMSLRGDTETPPQRADIKPYVRGLLPDIPENSKLVMEYDHLTEDIADLSNGVFDVAKVIARQFDPRLGHSSERVFPKSSDIGRLGDIVRDGNIISYGFQTTIGSDKEKAMGLFMGWILVSPVPLTNATLKEVFSDVYHNWRCSIGRKVDFSSDKPRLQPSDGQDQEYPHIGTILERCEPFVAVDHGNDCVYFTSANVKGIAAQTISNRTQRQLALAVVMTSLDYLDRTEDFAKGCCATEEELTKLLKKHPFLHQSAYLASYLALIRNEDFQGNEDVHEKIISLLNSKKRFLIMQVFLYTREEDHGEDKSPSWDKIIRFINSLSKLHVAALWGQLKPVEAFLEEDKDSTTQENYHGSRPLHEAAKSGVVEVVKALTCANPGIAHAVDNKGRTPLFYAWRGNHGDAIVVLFQAQCAYQTLEQLGDIEDKDTGRALREYCLAKSGLTSGANEARCMGIAMVRAIKEGFDVVAELLISKGANPSEVDDGISALYTAVQQGKDNLVAVLISAGADPTAGAPEGKEPVLHVAVRERLGLATLELLLQSSQNLDTYINCKDSRGRTALFPAMEVGDENWAMETMKRLLRYGLNVDLLDNDGNHIMHIVAQKGYTEVFSEITFQSRLEEEPKNKADRTPFDIARELEYEEIATFIRPTHKLTSRRYH